MQPQNFLSSECVFILECLRCHHYSFNWLKKRCCRCSGPVHIGNSNSLLQPFGTIMFEYTFNQFDLAPSTNIVKKSTRTIHFDGHSDINEIDVELFRLLDIAGRSIANWDDSGINEEQTQNTLQTAIMNINHSHKILLEDLRLLAKMIFDRTQQTDAIKQIMSLKYTIRTMKEFAQEFPHLLGEIEKLESLIVDIAQEIWKIVKRENQIE